MGVAELEDERPHAARLDADAEAREVVIPQYDLTGGDLAQDNARPVEVGGITQLSFVDGSDSHGHKRPAQTNRGVLQQDGVDVTDELVLGP